MMAESLHCSVFRICTCLCLLSASAFAQKYVNEIGSGIQLKGYSVRIGAERVCPARSEVHGFEVQPQGRISLTWATANRDPEVFSNPNDVDLERKPNPHVAFGFGHHNCLGARSGPARNLSVCSIYEATGGGAGFNIS